MEAVARAANCLILSHAPTLAEEEKKLYSIMCTITGKGFITFPFSVIHIDVQLSINAKKDNKVHMRETESVRLSVFILHLWTT
jgi:hypothetical protein